jgi:hypothetical protein
MTPEEAEKNTLARPEHRREGVNQNGAIFCAEDKAPSAKAGYGNTTVNVECLERGRFQSKNAGRCGSAANEKAASMSALITLPVESGGKPPNGKKRTSLVSGPGSGGELSSRLHRKNNL